MTDWSRLTEWLMDYFPDYDYYTKEDVKEYMRENIPAYDKMSNRDINTITKDWEAFAKKEKAEELRDEYGVFRRSFEKLRRFLGRLF